jgi:hypothetical protein
MCKRLLIAVTLFTMFATAYAADVLRDKNGNVVNVGSGTISNGEIVWTACGGAKKHYKPATDYKISEGANCPPLPVVAKAALGFCGPHMSRRGFVVDASGSVSDTGRTFEGPLCVDVFYNPIQSYVSLATATTTVNGPDLSKVTAGGSSQAGTLPKLPKTANISQEFAVLMKREEGVEGRLNDTKSSLVSATSTEDQAISEISLLRRTTKLRSASQVIDQVKQGYKGLKDDLHSAIGIIANYHPTDKPGPNQEPPVLNELQDISDRLARLPLAYIDIPTLDQKANRPLCASELQRAAGGGNELVFDPAKTESRNISWTDWSAQCKAGFDQFKALVDSKLADAKNYTDASDNIKGLKSKAAIVQYWDALFKDIGLRTEMTSKQIDDQDISPSFHARTGVRCGTLFNQTANTSINLVVADLTPTLDGKDPEIKAQGAFVTVSCSTPFSLSAGVGFSTIRQQEFAIIKSSGGTGNPSVNTFGVISDSSITPMPIVMTNVRLWDWSHHKYAFHGSFGISGNLQNQASGGSTAEFLPAGTLSFWRTMYVSMGPQIGTKPELVGNFKVGDPVPSDITTINGQVKRTRTVGFGFAITFTKP